MCEIACAARKSCYNKVGKKHSGWSVQTHKDGMTMKHGNLVSQMTLEEKCALLAGKDVWHTREIPRLNIPAITLSDGPSGLRKQAGEGDHLGLNASTKATCIPSAATLACSWDATVSEAMGAVVGARRCQSEGGCAACAGAEHEALQPGAAAASSITPKTRTSPASWRRASSAARRSRVYPPAQSTTRRTRRSCCGCTPTA